MSSDWQVPKSRQELLEEYEKDYLQRLENENNQQVDSEQDAGIDNLLNLQDVLLTFAKETKKLEAKDYIGQCVACKENVSRDEMKYDDGRIFHPECFEKFGDQFLIANKELSLKTRQAKIELVQLRNLKVRRIANSSTTKKTPKRKSTKKKTSKKVTKGKKSARKTRTKKVKRKVAKRKIRRSAKKKSRRR